MDFCKIEQLHILRELLVIEESLFQSKLLLHDMNEFYSVSTDDHERYLKMAIEIDSNDPVMLIRKKKKIIRKRSSE